MPQLARAPGPGAAALKPPTAARRNRPERAAPVGMPANAPAYGIHPFAFRLAMIAAVWFILVMAISFGGGETDLPLGIIYVFSTIFFGLMIGFGISASRRDRQRESFREFVEGDADIASGRIKGREALLQLLILPTTLALGATAIGLVFLIEQ